MHQELNSLLLILIIIVRLESLTLKKYKTKYSKMAQLRDDKKLITFFLQFPPARTEP